MTGIQNDVNSLFAGVKSFSIFQDDSEKGSGFQDLLTKTMTQAGQAVRENEQMAKKQALGEIDLTQMVTNTAQLDVMVSTLTALRDKIISGVQELQKMPI